ncbi:hypothetical protein [Streptomyces bluensis]|uniref:Uncharacterized protein n=1 Tax=Streptomyces bluensis TaxID=33897 RepID=A0ABW6UUR8_9ACTN
MLATYKARQRHQKIMRVAHHLLREAFISVRREPSDVTAEHVAAFAFARYRMDLDLDEAQRYLDAARVTRGEPTTPTPTNTIQPAIHHSA